MFYYERDSSPSPLIAEKENTTCGLGWKKKKKRRKQKKLFDSKCSLGGDVERLSVNYVCLSLHSTHVPSPLLSHAEKGARFADNSERAGKVFAGSRRRNIVISCAALLSNSSSLFGEFYFAFDLLSFWHFACIFCATAHAHLIPLLVLYQHDN